MNAVLVYFQMCFAMLAYRTSVLLAFAVPLPFLYSLYMYFQESNFYNVALVVLSIIVSPAVNILANILIQLSLRLDPTYKNEPSNK